MDAGYNQQIDGWMHENGVTFFYFIKMVGKKTNGNFKLVIGQLINAQIVGYF